MYFIELLTTKRCNKDCYYCTSRNNSDPVMVDIDYLKWVLDQLPDETGVELTGGEVGLIENLEDVYRAVSESPKIKHIMVLSNGLVRKLNPDWLKDVEYWEHLIYEIKGKEIIKFYTDLDLEQKHRYVIVTTDVTTRSLLANWEYFEERGLFRPNFFYKLMNHKSKSGIDSYVDELIKLYERVGERYFQKMLIHYKMNGFLSKEKTKCELLSPNPFVDLQTRQLGHCAINLRQSDKWDFNRKNLELLRTGKFYRRCEYCSSCYSFDHGQSRGKNYNRSYENLE